MMPEYKELRCTRSVFGGMCQERVKYIIKFRSENDYDYETDDNITFYPRCYKHMLEDRDFAVSVELIDPNLINMK